MILYKDIFISYRFSGKIEFSIYELFTLIYKLFIFMMITAKAALKCTHHTFK